MVTSWASGRAEGKDDVIEGPWPDHEAGMDRGLYFIISRGQKRVQDTCEKSRMAGWEGTTASWSCRLFGGLTVHPPARPGFPLALVRGGAKLFNFSFSSSSKSTRVCLSRGPTVESSIRPYVSRQNSCQRWHRQGAVFLFRVAEEKDGQRWHFQVSNALFECFPAGSDTVDRGTPLPGDRPAFAKLLPDALDATPILALRVPRVPLKVVVGLLQHPLSPAPFVSRTSP